MPIEPVQIRRARSAVPAVLQPALKLRVEPDSRTQVDIGREQVPLEEIAVGVSWSDAKGGLIQEFKSLPKFPADCQIPARAPERDVFERIEPIRSFAGS